MAQVEKKITAPAGGILNSITSWFKSLFNSVRQFNLFNVGTREVIPDIDQTNAIDKGFNTNAAVYSIVMRDADKFASIPRYLVDPKKLAEKAKKVPFRLKHMVKALPGKSGINTQGALEKLLNRPNEWQGQAAFYKTTRAFYDLCGESFTWLNRGDITGLTDIQADLAEIQEMIPLPTQCVEIVPDGTLNGVAGYLLVVNGLKIPLRKNDVIHWKNVNLAFDGSTKVHLRGMTPLKPGAATLQQNADATYSAVRMYKNDGAKGVIFNESFDEATPEQETSIRNTIDNKINNVDVKGAVAALQGKWGYLDMSASSVDMELLAGIEITWKVLCFLFGVPYELFDTETTYANKEMAQKGWVTNKIIPACKELDDEFNRMLLKAFALEGRLIIQSDYSELPELQDDMGKLVEWLLKAYWITPNEKREIQGYEERPEPEMDEPWFPTSIQPLSAMQDDGFGTMMNDLGVGGDYPDPQKQDDPPPEVDPKKNGKAKKHFAY